MKFRLKLWFHKFMMRAYLKRMVASCEDADMFRAAYDQEFQIIWNLLNEPAKEEVLR